MSERWPTVGHTVYLFCEKKIMKSDKWRPRMPAPGRILHGLLETMKSGFRRGPDTVLPPDMSETFTDLFVRCGAFTMTSAERMYALYQATRYIVEQGIPGDIVECGVWRGGSAMLSALTLVELKDTRRKIYLYDTYAGMTEPSDRDVDSQDKRPAWEIWRSTQRSDHNDWCYAPLDEVRENLFSTGYPRENLVFVKGMVEETIPRTIPEQVASLRLDTDWYESTYHSLRHLFPRLARYGVLIIDDYGHWEGAKEATDQYFRENPTRLLLNRIDYTGRITIKIDD